jgi:hypothetical protein
MRRLLALGVLVLCGCPPESAPDAAPVPTPTKLVFEGVDHTELTEDFHLGDPLPPSGPLSDSEKALVALARARFLELAAAEHLGGCDDAPYQTRTRISGAGLLSVTFQQGATLDEWEGEGCCTPCLTPCVPGSCGYCSPADSCQHFATGRILRVSFELDDRGGVHAEHLVRMTSARKLVPAEVYVPIGPHRGAKVTIATLEFTQPLPEHQKLEAWLKSRSRAVLACYEREQRRDATLAGKLALRFDIIPSGRASEVEIEENALNVAVASCVKTVVRGWVFPFKPEQNATVAIAFSFAP